MERYYMWVKNFSGRWNQIGTMCGYGELAELKEDCEFYISRRTYKILKATVIENGN